MKLRLTLAAAAALLCGAPAAAQDAPAAPDYSSDSAWLCLPGRDDSCARPLPTAALNPNGYGSNGQAVPAKDPGVDCFYIYPTVSRDDALNSDIAAGPEEQSVAAVQFARFAGVCRPFAPLYRQVTLKAIPLAAAGQNVLPNFILAYSDVAKAWRYYLEHYNRGRPFVIISHSQGTIHASQIIAREIENGPAAAHMLSAILLGYNVEVPEGKLVGGTFKKTPLCSRVGETGCVIAFTSFRATNPPPPGALFGRAAGPGMTVGCTNPAGFAHGSAPLDSYWYTGPSSATANRPIHWSSEGAPPAAYLRTEGLVSASCVNRGNVGYLAISVNADPSDKRTDEIPGDVSIGGRAMPGWGLHLSDMNLAMGDLLALVEAQAASVSASPATHGTARRPKARRR
jgi:hypothetical protein